MTIYIGIFNPDSPKIGPHMKTARSISRVGIMSPSNLTGDVTTKAWEMVRDIEPINWPKSKRTWVYDPDTHTDENVLDAFTELGSDKIDVILFDEQFYEDVLVASGDIEATDTEKKRRKGARKKHRDKKDKEKKDKEKKDNK